MDCTFAILVLPRGKGPLSAQVTLQPHHGGLGLAWASLAEGRVAYLSTAAAADLAMRSGPHSIPAVWRVVVWYSAPSG
jgi:hypothetical protein